MPANRLPRAPWITLVGVMRIAAVVLLIALAAALAADIPVIQPKDLAAQLRSSAGHPLIFHVGIPYQYRSKHIPGAIATGPAGSAEGITGLRAAVAKIPKDADIVIYCGCCPWDHCPNIKPAMELLRMMGYTKVRALNIPSNMPTDWYDKGYPTEGGQPLDPMAKPVK